MSDRNDVVILNLDRPRMVWFGHKALKTLGAITGKSLNDLVESLSEPTFEDIETIMYCGLVTDAKKNGEVLKLEDMEDLLDMAPYSKITEAMNKALESSMGSPQNEEVKNQQGTVKKTKK